MEATLYRGSKFASLPNKPMSAGKLGLGYYFSSNIKKAKEFGKVSTFKLDVGRFLDSTKELTLKSAQKIFGVAVKNIWYEDKKRTVKELLEDIGRIKDKSLQNKLIDSLKKKYDSAGDSDYFEIVFFDKPDVTPKEDKEYTISGTWTIKSPVELKKALKEHGNFFGVLCQIDNTEKILDIKDTNVKKPFPLRNLVQEYKLNPTKIDREIAQKEQAIEALEKKERPALPLFYIQRKTKNKVPVYEQSQVPLKSHHKYLRTMGLEKCSKLQGDIVILYNNTLNNKRFGLRQNKGE